ncbi:MAG: histidine kinase [Acidobacteria bacterium]|nr:histidine kinase [Acidobacteriota bacterium]
MRLGALRHHVASRLRKPWVWASILVFWLPFAGISLFLYRKIGYENALLAGASSLLCPMAVAFFYAVLSPLGWLWTGDSRLEAPFLRAIPQALVFNGASMMAIVLFEVFLLRLAGLKAPLPFGPVLLSNLALHAPASTLVGWFIMSGERTEREKRAAEHRAAEAQWILLKGQLSPHFLFNALNGLAELVHTDADAAEKALLDLAELYRGLLTHGDEPLEVLRQERMLVERYLAVEHTRLGERLKVTWAWDPTLDEVRTPPFILQPLVENALKHGIAPFPKGGELRISLTREGGGMRLQVANTGRALPLVLGNGTGLRNLEARLELAYGKAASLRLRSEGEWVVADLLLPMEAKGGYA